MRRIGPSYKCGLEDAGEVAKHLEGGMFGIYKMRDKPESASGIVHKSAISAEDFGRLALPGKVLGSRERPSSYHIWDLNTKDPVRGRSGNMRLKYAEEEGVYVTVYDRKENRLLLFAKEDDILKPVGYIYGCLLEDGQSLCEALMGQGFQVEPIGRRGDLAVRKNGSILGVLNPRIRYKPHKLFLKRLID